MNLYELFMEDQYIYSNDFVLKHESFIIWKMDLISIFPEYSISIQMHHVQRPKKHLYTMYKCVDNIGCA